MTWGDKLSLEERDQDIVALSRLLNYAQLEAKRLDLDRTEHDLRAALSSLLDDSADVLSSMVGRNGVTVRVDQA